MSSAAAAKMAPSSSPAFDIEAALKALNEVRTGKSSAVWLKPFAPSEKSGNELIFFVKPEALLDGIDHRAILQHVSEAFAKFGVEVEAAATLGADYLKANNIMGQHYGVINAISTQGINALAGDVRTKFETDFAADLSAGAKVMGGHQILDAYKFMTPEALDVLWTAVNPSVKKVAPGTYAIALQIQSDRVVGLNGFHPYQLLHFTAPGRAIIMFKVRSQTPWKDLRDNMIGDTEVTKANPGSLRRTFLDRQKDLRIPVVNKGNNGVHLSAGPLEGMFEIIRFCSDYAKSGKITPDKTSFGKQLAAAGLSGKLESLARNPLIKTPQKAQSAFDLTELMEPASAIETLKQYESQY